MKKRLKIIPLSLALLVPLVFALTRGSAPAASGNVDVDLSALSSTMVCIDARQRPGGVRKCRRGFVRVEQHDGLRAIIQYFDGLGKLSG